LSPKSSPRAAKPHPSHPRYIALLRAVNVGGRVIKMDQLKRAFEALSLANVQTFIASGNVIFETPIAKTVEIETVIEAGLQRAFKYPVLTFVRTPAEMIAASWQSPFTPADLENAGLYVTFLKSPLDKASAKKVLTLRTADDDFAVVGREIYWLRRRMKERMGEPFPPLEKAVSVPGTMRSITTVRKLAAKYCGDVGTAGT
jgi:uncharacterized protein (DUF1697 family)